MQTKNIPDPIKTLIKQTEVKPDPIEKVKKSLISFKLKPKTKASLLVAVILLILVMVLMVFQNNISPPVSPEPTPVPTATATPKAESPYATDSAVLKLENDLNNLENELKNTSFRDSSLLLPQIDMNVSFNVTN